MFYTVILGMNSQHVSAEISQFLHCSSYHVGVTVLKNDDFRINQKDVFCSELARKVI